MATLQLINAVTYIQPGWKKPLKIGETIECSDEEKDALLQMVNFDKVGNSHPLFREVEGNAGKVRKKELPLRAGASRSTTGYGEDVEETEVESPDLTQEDVVDAMEPSDGRPRRRRRKTEE